VKEEKSFEKMTEIRD